MSPRAFRRTLTLAVLLAAASAGQALAQTAQSAQAAQAAEPPAATTDQQAAAPPPALPPGPVVAKPGGVRGISPSMNFSYISHTLPSEPAGLPTFALPVSAPAGRTDA